MAALPQKQSVPAARAQSATQAMSVTRSIGLERVSTHQPGGRPRRLLDGPGIREGDELHLQAPAGRISRNRCARPR